MKYDPIKRKLGVVFNRTPALRKLFYRLLDILLLRSWHIRKALKEWEKAVNKFQTIVAMQSNYADAVSKLETAQQQLKLAELDKKAQEAEVQGNWDSAVQALEILAKEFPKQAAIIARLEEARKRKRLENLYTEARQLSEGQKWLAVLQVFDQIHALDPEFPDSDALLS